jgi:hypothetical protein
LDYLWRITDACSSTNVTLLVILVRAVLLLTETVPVAVTVSLCF